jgi:hypothetical protein
MTVAGVGNLLDTEENSIEAINLAGKSDAETQKI